MKNLIVFAMLAAALTIFNGCQKENQIVDDLRSPDKIIEIFQPTYEVEVKNGMLVFESKLAFDVTKLEIAGADRKTVDLWDKS